MRRKKFKCEEKECGEVFKSYDESVQHMKTVHDLKFYVCELCDETVYSRQQLKVHHAAQHSMKDTTCMFCNDTQFKFNIRQSLAKHIIEKHPAEIGYIRNGSEREKGKGFVLSPSSALVEKLDLVLGNKNRFKVLVNQRFLLGFDETIRMARWCYEELMYSQSNDYYNPRSRWEEDRRVFKQLTEPGITFLPQCVIGHLSAAANHSTYINGQEESCYMTNTAPMVNTMNNGPWKMIENHTRNLVLYWDSVTILTGPVFNETNDGELVEGGYLIKKPTSFYKVIILKKPNWPLLSQCFIVPNTTTRESFWRYKATLAEVHEASGIEFFPNITILESWSQEAMQFSFKCDICGLVFSAEEELKHHKESHGIWSTTVKLDFKNEEQKKKFFEERKTFVCDWPGCSKSFLNVFMRDRHYVTHTQTKEFPCDICNERFGRKEDMVRHKQRIHTDEKPYKCPGIGCDLAFNANSNWYRHMKTCTKLNATPRPKIKCDKCGRNFTTPGNLKRHLKSCPMNATKSTTPKKRSHSTSDEDCAEERDSDFVSPKMKSSSSSQQQPHKDKHSSSSSSSKSKNKRKKVKKDSGRSSISQVKRPYTLLDYVRSVSKNVEKKVTKEKVHSDMEVGSEDDVTLVSDDSVKWKFLEHKGPVFAPPYERIPKSVQFRYNGKVMRLSQDTEEIAGFYSRLIEHDYTTKDQFNINFFKDWRKSMTPEERETITDLKKCDFRDINEYFKQKSEERKAMSKEENEALIKEYGIAVIDGHKEKVGNFRIEPPGLFMGEGDHPKMGMLKKRIIPEDVIINCSKDSKAPKAPDGRKWKEVRHDNTVSWLACWTENVQGQQKYVMLNPTYEKARELAKHIDKIRENYKEDFKSKEMRVRQRAVAMYFIDKLALRVGNEKDEDQADTVGCCSLRYEHLKLMDKKDGKENVVIFDFLGKDSIRYYNEVPVEKRVYKNLKIFMENKKEGDDLFDRLNTAVLNKHLNELMPGLTANVFRTYNASHTLQSPEEG